MTIKWRASNFIASRRVGGWRRLLLTPLHQSCVRFVSKNCIVLCAYEYCSTILHLLWLHLYECPITVIRCVYDNSLSITIITPADDALLPSLFIKLHNTGGLISRIVSLCTIDIGFVFTVRYFVASNYLFVPVINHLLFYDYIFWVIVTSCPWTVSQI